MREMHTVLEDLLSKLQTERNTILIIEGVTLAVVLGLTGLIALPAGLVSVGISTAAELTTWSASYFLLDDLLTRFFNDVIKRN